MAPLWNCPIRQQILTDCFGTSGDDTSVLTSMEGVLLHDIFLDSEIVERELLRPNYPLPQIRRTFDAPEDFQAEILATIRGKNMLPRLLPSTAAHVVSALSSDPDKRYPPYWILRWNEIRSNQPLGNFRGDSDRLSGWANIVKQHPRVCGIRLRDDDSDLNSAEWNWERELQWLTVRGILRFVSAGCQSFEETTKDCERRFLEAVGEYCDGKCDVPNADDFCPMIGDQCVGREAAFHWLKECVRCAKGFEDSKDPNALNSLVYSGAMGARFSSVETFMELLGHDLEGSEIVELAI